MPVSRVPGYQAGTDGRAMGNVQQYHQSLHKATAYAMMVDAMGHHPQIVPGRKRLIVGTSSSLFQANPLFRKASATYGLNTFCAFVMCP